MSVWSLAHVWQCYVSVELGSCMAMLCQCGAWLMYGTMWSLAHVHIHTNGVVMVLSMHKGQPYGGGGRTNEN